MSIAVINAVFEHSEAKGTDRLVLLVLAQHARDDGTEARPSQKRIAEMAGVKVEAVRRSLRRLERARELECVTPSTPRKPAIYRVTPPGRDPSETEAQTPPGGGVRPLPNEGSDPSEMRGEQSYNRPDTRPGRTSTRVQACESGEGDSSSPLTDEVLAYFYEKTGASPSVKNRTWFANAIAANPDVTAKEWPEVIDWRFANPWWKDDGNPNAGLVCFASRLAEAIKAVRSPVPTLPGVKLTSNGALLRSLGA